MTITFFLTTKFKKIVTASRPDNGLFTAIETPSQEKSFLKNRVVDSKVLFSARINVQIIISKQRLLHE